jgi:NADPH:quinone reductase-like Zn-dependent oxidoreductase
MNLEMKMKAAFRSAYGTGEVLSVRGVEKPSPGDHEVLIKVHATTVSRTDCHVLWGRPMFMRLFTGRIKPKLTITGTDFAGEIVEVGKNVKAYKPGARIMGFEFNGLRSHAEYITLPGSAEMAAVPANLSWEESAACVEGAFYALNLIHQFKPRSGQTAMVAGATGAIGSAIVQFFKFHGVHVTATCRGEHSDLVKALGASRVIDYTKEDFTKDAERFDFVFDAVGKHSFGKCKVLLKPQGLYSSSGFPNLLAVLFTSILGGKRCIFAPPKDLTGCLNFTRALAEEGKFKPVIDRIIPLEKISEAFEYVGSGQKVGNVVISMVGGGAPVSLHSYKSGHSDFISNLL